MAKATLKEIKKLHSVTLELNVEEAVWLRGILGGICCLPQTAIDIFELLDIPAIPKVTNMYHAFPSIKEGVDNEVKAAISNWEF